MNQKYSTVTLPVAHHFMWFVQPLNQFTQILNSREYSGLEFKSIILDDETHYSSFGNAFTKGLKWLFTTYQK